MAKTRLEKRRAARNAEISRQQLVKTFKGDFYSVNSIIGNDCANWYIITGGRMVGKSYSCLNFVARQKLRHPDKVKLYYLRLTDTQKEKLLKNNAQGMVDPDLKRKYKIQTLRKGDDVYVYNPREVPKDDGSVEIKKDNLQFMKTCPCTF